MILRLTRTILASDYFNRSLDYLLKIFILTFFFWVLYSQLVIENKINHLSEVWLLSISKIIALTFVCVLMTANWAVEAFKWQFLINSIQRISYLKAVKAVLGGLTFAVVTPARIGEIGGRVLFLNKKRFKSLIITIIGSLSQLMVTIIFGLSSLILFSYLILNVTVAILFLIPFLICTLIYLFYNLHKVYRILLKFRYTNRLGRILRISIFYRFLAERRVLNFLLLYSTIRYIIFTVQYLLLLYIFGLQIDILVAVIIIDTIFLLQSILPTPAIAELGIRNGIAVFLFSFATPQVGPVIAAATLIWMINLLLPAIIGSGFVVQKQLIKSKVL